MENFEAMLRGANFRPIEARAIVNNLQEGDILALQREPFNRFDENAIMVLSPENQTHLGYVAKEIAVYLAPLMDDGLTFKCEVGVRLSSTQLGLNITQTDNPDHHDNDQSAQLG